MRVAIYPSVLYGDDFIQESIASILPWVNSVYVVMMSRPWGDTSGVTYKGEWISWPGKFDATREKIAEMANSKIEVIESYKHSPWNRWGHAAGLVLEKCSPDEIMMIDPDCVFSDLEAARVFLEWNNLTSAPWATPKQVELWRTPEWQVIRPRSMVSLHRGDLSLLVSNTEATRPKTHQLAGSVHNFGFCVSERNMLWKHLCAMAFSPIIGESLPNPDWYEKKWITWDPLINNENLEVSIGCESAIPKAVPYDVMQLPESIRWRYKLGGVHE